MIIHWFYVDLLLSSINSLNKIISIGNHVGAYWGGLRTPVTSKTKKKNENCSRQMPTNKYSKDTAWMFSLSKLNNFSIVCTAKSYWLCRLYTQFNCHTIFDPPKIAQCDS